MFLHPVKLHRHNCADEECDGEPYGESLVWRTVAK